MSGKPGSFMEQDLWGEIDIADWRSVPCIHRRLASEADVNEGRAVFFLSDPNGLGASPVDMSLPRPAILREENGGEIPVILIQSEEGGGKIYAGYRFLDGGNGVCHLEELELLDEPDDRFFLF